jgi:hypothetical protein
MNAVRSIDADNKMGNVYVLRVTSGFVEMKTECGWYESRSNESTKRPEIIPHVHKQVVLRLHVHKQGSTTIRNEHSDEHSGSDEHSDEMSTVMCK